MTGGELFAWIMSLPVLLDGTPQHNPIPRDKIVIQAIADFCSLAEDEDEAKTCGATEDFLSAREAGYHEQIAGDCPGLPPGDLSCTREKGAKSCGAFQLSCDVVKPTTTIATQVRMAWKVWKTWREKCPKHPMWGYAFGACVITTTADRYEREIRKQLLAGGVIR